MGRTDFDVSIPVPGTNFKRSSECFVQWRDPKTNQTWGLNFQSSDDAIKFLEACSTADCIHSTLVYTPSRLSLYVPVPDQPEPTEEDVDIKGASIAGSETSCSSPGDDDSTSWDSRHSSTRASPVSKHAGFDADMSSIGSPQSADPPAARDFIAGMDPPAVDRTSKMPAAANKQLESVMFSQLEEISVDVATINEATEIEKTSDEVDPIGESPSEENPAGNLEDVQLRDEEKTSFQLDDLPPPLPLSAPPPPPIETPRLVTVTRRDLPETELPVYAVLLENDFVLGRTIDDIRRSYVNGPLSAPTSGESRGGGTSGSDSGFAGELPLSPLAQEQASSLKVFLARTNSDLTTTTATTTSTAESQGNSTNLSASGGDKATREREFDASSLETSVDSEEVLNSNDRTRNLEILNPAVPLVHQDSDVGRLRKTGWLHLKVILSSKNGKVAEASKRKWKRYWAALVGTALSFYERDDTAGVDVDEDHAHVKLDVRGGLAQSLHEYVKRDYVFCLSIATGYVFYVQAASQTDVDAWITAIHSGGALAEAKTESRLESIRILNERISRLEEESESEGKILKMAELQLETERNQLTKEKISEQVKSWSMNAERLHMDAYRLKCYVASTQGTELPNPQSILARVTKMTKTALGRLQKGLTVSSLHAFVSARRSAGKTPTDDSFYVKRSDSPKLGRSPRPKTRFTKHIKAGLRHFVAGSKDSSKSETEKARRPSVDIRDESELEVVELQPGQRIWETFQSQTVRIKLPNKQFVSLPLEGLTSFGILRAVYQQMHLDPQEHFVVLHRRTDDGSKEYFVPEEDFPLNSMDFEDVEVIAKVRLDVHMTQTPDSHLGFSVEFESPDEGLSTYGCLVVSHVDSGGLAESHGLLEGDDILAVNGTSVDELGIAEALTIIESACFGISGLLSLTVRSRRLEMPVFQKTTDSLINHLILPPPESQEQELTKEDVMGLIVPPPDLDFGGLTSGGGGGGDGGPTIVPMAANASDLDPFSSLTLDSLQAILHNVDELTKYVRSLHDETIGLPPQTSRQLTREEKLEKCVGELVETERTYVKQLQVLLGRYMRPLRSESFLRKDEINSLFGNLEDIVPFQEEFLEALEEAARLDGTGPAAVRNMVFSVAGAFLYHAADFKRYSTFCASRTHAEEILERDNIDPRLKEFLAARNPKRQLSASLPSYLILPIQRILRYPLFLKSMHKLTEADSDARAQLADAIVKVEEVADFINEVQRVHDTYHSVFDSLVNKANLRESGLRAIVSELIFNCSVMWLNPIEGIEKKALKKGLGPDVLCFVFKSLIILLVPDKEKKTKKKPKASVTLVKEEEEFRYKQILLTSHSSVNDLPDSDGVTDMWRLVCRDDMSQREDRYIFRSSSSEEKNVALKSIQSVIALRLETVQKILAAVTPGKRKRSRSGSSLQLVPGAGYQRKRSGSIDSSASYSSFGPVVLSGLNRALLSPTFKPENETLPEDIEC